MLEAALQALDLANLDLNLPAQLLVLGSQVLEVRRSLVRVLPRKRGREEESMTGVCQPKTKSKGACAYERCVPDLSQPPTPSLLTKILLCPVPL